jgi:hypothetical protein
MGRDSFNSYVDQTLANHRQTAAQEDNLISWFSGGCVVALVGWLDKLRLAPQEIKNLILITIICFSLCTIIKIVVVRISKKWLKESCDQLLFNKTILKNSVFIGRLDLSVFTLLCSGIVLSLLTMLFYYF